MRRGRSRSRAQAGNRKRSAAAPDAVRHGECRPAFRARRVIGQPMGKAHGVVVVDGTRARVGAPHAARRKVGAQARHRRHLPSRQLRETHARAGLGRQRHDSPVVPRAHKHVATEGRDRAALQHGAVCAQRGRHARGGASPTRGHRRHGRSVGARRPRISRVQAVCGSASHGDRGLLRERVGYARRRLEYRSVPRPRGRQGHARRRRYGARILPAV